MCSLKFDENTQQILGGLDSSVHILDFYSTNDNLQLFIGVCAHENLQWYYLLMAAAYQLGNCLQAARAYKEADASLVKYNKS